MGKITREYANTIGLGQTVQTGLNFRNYIINGDMNISQRGTSFTGLGNGDIQYTLDRWRFVEEGTITNEWTISQASDAPSGSDTESFSKSLKIECTTADATLDADSIQFIEQRVEAQNLQNLHFGSVNARNLNLAFWVKSNKTGTYTVNIVNEDAGRSASLTYTIDTADTWIKKDINFGKDTVGVINNDNGAGLILQFNLAAGTNKSSGSVQSWAADVQANRAPGQVNLADDTANEFYLTGVQLERGKFDTDFETLPYDVTLRRCLRYYEELGVASFAQANDTLSYWISFNYRERKRANPSASLLTTSISIAGWGVFTRTTTSATIASSYLNNLDAGYVRVGGFTGNTAGETGTPFQAFAEVNGVQPFIAFDSEL